MKTKKVHLIFLLFFLLVCLLPVGTMVAGYQAKNLENRPLARMPGLTMRSGGLNLAFPAEFDRYFEDHFGLREEMVTGFHALTMTLFSDTLNEDVVVGKKGMFFFGETMDDYLGLHLLSDEEITRIAVSLRLQQEYAYSKDAGFAFAVAPNKNTVYPEYMPDSLPKSTVIGNRERLYDALERENVNTTDLAAVLISKKGENLLYHTHDTHWNDLGAVHAFHALMETAALPFAHTDYTELTPQWLCDYAGDLHYFVLPSQAGRELRPYYAEIGALSERYALEAGARPAQDIAYGTYATGGYRFNGTLYMMRDSFAEALIPLFSAEFQRAIYSSELPYHYTGMEEEERPAAVIIELVERNIRNLLLSAPLMPAVEKEVPAITPANSQTAKAVTRTHDGYTEIIGCLEGGYQNEIYLLLEGENESHCFEAFPMLDDQAREITAGFNEPAGFTLTLPAYVKGEFDVTVISGNTVGRAGSVRIV